ncbi:MAG: NAD(+) diphosphatase [Acidobacteriota bacterium]
MDSWAFAFSDHRLLVHLDGRRARLPTLDELIADTVAPHLAPIRQQYLGEYLGRGVVSVELESSAEAPPGMALDGLRALFMRLDEPLFWIAARAIQIVAWDRDHQICGRCGTATGNQSHELSKKCPSCSLVHYPRLAPAIIVLVERGEEVLLGRSAHFPPGMFSTLAGFVEPGESLEQTVAREIEEEVGVQVHNVRYFGSQPWPFPNSLMIGFHADWASGDIVVDQDELEEAAWFHIDDLPKIPPRISIARALLDAWIARHRPSRS